MSGEAASNGGQAVVGDVSASPHGDIGTVGIIGNGATGNVIIQNLNIYFMQMQGEHVCDLKGAIK
jgi:hypothetical protein